MNPPVPISMQQGDRTYEFISDPLHKVNLSGRVTAACLNCRRKKIKCSGEINCRQCREKGLQCEGPPSRKRPARDHASSSSLTNTPSSIAEPPPSTVVSGRRECSSEEPVRPKWPQGDSGYDSDRRSAGVRNEVEARTTEERGASPMASPETMAAPSHPAPFDPHPPDPSPPTSLQSRAPAPASPAQRFSGEWRVGRHPGTFGRDTGGIFRPSISPHGHGAMRDGAASSGMAVWPYQEDAGGMWPGIHGHSSTERTSLAESFRTDADHGPAAYISDGGYTIQPPAEGQLHRAPYDLHRSMPNAPLNGVAERQFHTGSTIQSISDEMQYMGWWDVNLDHMIPQPTDPPYPLDRVFSMHDYPTDASSLQTTPSQHNLPDFDLDEVHDAAQRYGERS